MPTYTKATAAAKELMIRVLGIKQPEAQGSDSLDFHDLHVDTLQRALEGAYAAGARAALESTRPGIKETMASQARLKS